MKEKIGSKVKCEITQKEIDSSDSDEDNDELPEFIDWRAKKGHN